MLQKFTKKPLDVSTSKMLTYVDDLFEYKLLRLPKNGFVF